MTDNNDIPADILNYNASKATQIKANYQKKVKNSGFFLTITPNLGRKILDNQQQRINEYRKLEAVNAKIIEGFKQGRFIKQMNDATPLNPETRLTEGRQRIEIGENKIGLHTHFILGFNGACHIDTRALHDFMRQFYDVNPKIQARFKDLYGRQSIEDYIDKGVQDENNQFEEQLAKKQPRASVGRIG